MFPTRTPILRAAALLSVAALSALLPVVAAAEKPAAAWNVADHLKFEQVVVQGHRGVGNLAEENTVEAFELAWKLGIYPESDLRMTKDGVIVPFHDNNFARVVKDASPALKKKGVKDLTFAELAKLDVGSWKGPEFAGRRVMPMATIFELMRGRPERHLYMDIKSIDFKKLAAEIHKYGLEKQVVLASRKVEEIRAWKELVPESDTLLWMHGNEAELRRDLEALRATRYAGITQIQIHVYPKQTTDTWAPPTDPSGPENPFRLRNAFLREVGEELRRFGVTFQAFPYTEAPEVYGQLMDLGVASFATDHPDVAMREIKAYFDRRRAAR